MFDKNNEYIPHYLIPIYSEANKEVDRIFSIPYVPSIPIHKNNDYTIFNALKIISFIADNMPMCFVLFPPPSFWLNTLMQNIFQRPHTYNVARSYFFVDKNSELPQENNSQNTQNENFAGLKKGFLIK